MVVIAWIAVNAAAVSLRWDPYPFILLNLLFSTQAAYAAPLILLAQNRQDARDRALAERDREVNARILSDTEFLSRELAAIRLRLEAVATTDELDAMHEELAELIGPDPDRPDGRTRRAGRWFGAAPRVPGPDRTYNQAGRVPMTPSASHASRVASSMPTSPRTSRVCSPSNGGRRFNSWGPQAENVTGKLGYPAVPVTGWSNALQDLARR